MWLVFRCSMLARIHIPEGHHHASLKSFMRIPFVDPTYILGLALVEGGIQVWIHRGAIDGCDFTNIVIEQDYSRYPWQCGEGIA
jgi:hypothetical protein